MRIKAISVMVVFLFFVPQSGASAGGWWDTIQVDHRYVASGQRIEAGTPFLFETIELAEEARDEGFFAYLIEGLDREMLDEGMGEQWDPGWWKQRWTAAHEVGRVELSNWDANQAVARSVFEVPALPSGRYDLMFCSAECAEPLGHIVPAAVTIASDPLAARVASAFRNYRMEATFRDQRLRHDLRELRASLRDQGTRLDHTQDELDKVLDRLRQKPVEESEAPLSWGLGWLAAGLLGGAFVPAWRRRASKQGERSENNESGSGVSPT